MKEQIHPADLSELLKTLPPVIPRKDIDRYLGGLVSKGYLAVGLQDVVHCDTDSAHGRFPL